MTFNPRRRPQNRAERRRQARGSRGRSPSRQGSDRSLLLVIGLFFLLVIALLAVVVYTLT